MGKSTPGVKSMATGQAKLRRVRAIVVATKGCLYRLTQSNVETLTELSMSDRALKNRTGGAAIQRDDQAKSQKEVAAYIAELSGDLAVLARRSGHETLGYLLDIARLEAENVSRMIRAR